MPERAVRRRPYGGITYSASPLGDFRGEYHRYEQVEFDRLGDTFGDERVRVSINDDFLGKPVSE